MTVTEVVAAAEMTGVVQGWGARILAAAYRAGVARAAVALIKAGISTFLGIIDGQVRQAGDTVKDNVVNGTHRRVAWSPVDWNAVGIGFAINLFLEFGYLGAIKALDVTAEQELIHNGIKIQTKAYNQAAVEAGEELWKLPPFDEFFEAAVIRVGRRVGETVFSNRFSLGGIIEEGSKAIASIITSLFPNANGDFDYPWAPDAMALFYGQDVVGTGGR